MLNEKHKSKSEEKQRREKGIWKRKQDRKPEKEKGMMKKTLKFNSFMLFFSWNKSKEERKIKKKTKKEPKESK